MDFKTFRTKLKKSQEEIGADLEDHAAVIFPTDARIIKSQRTIGYWEQGVMPRPYWLKVIEDFSKGKVKAADFLKNANQ